METRLILIRHGETDDNVADRVAGWRDSALTDRGRVQVEHIGEIVNSNDIHSIVCWNVTDHLGDWA